MRTILEKIASLRNGRPATIDKSNANRYCLLLNEADGSKTGYYFSAPIYRARDGKLLNLRFEKKDTMAEFEGSNATVSLAQKIKLTNEEGRCLIYLPGVLGEVNEDCAKWGGATLYPTLNGIACRAKGKHGFTFELEAMDRTLGIRSTDKCFCLMREKFRPFVVVASIGTVNEKGAVVASAKITYEKTEDDTYRITVHPWESRGEEVMFEINLYENKLLQDTTVESAYGYSNNVFGTTAFLGKTPFFGEQWLYARPDMGKIPELYAVRIQSAVLHMAKHANVTLPLRAYGVSARFCSFGANWNNKVGNTPDYTDALVEGEDIALPVTPFLADAAMGYAKASNGWIVKPMKQDGSFAPLSLADSCYAPQILEVNFV